MDKSVNAIKRLGLFGGTFDPIHLGHLKMALRAQKDLDLDQVDFVVAKNPPFKTNKVVLNYQARLNLVRKALESYLSFTVSKFEDQESEISYSYKTVEYYKKNFPQAQLFWIIGYDAFLDLPKWANYDYLQANLKFIVFCRNHLPNPQIKNQKLQYSFISDFDCKASSTLIRELLKDNKIDLLTEYLPSNLIDLVVDNYLPRI